MSSNVNPSPSSRLSSLDQFRGYTMLGMMLVNYLGAYAICPRILRHTNDYCSYADTIMPQFFFAVGFAMRLSLGKRFEAGKKMPWGRIVRRILGLAIIAVIWYSMADFSGVISALTTQPTGYAIYTLFKGLYFQTLLHIAATSLWILPVVAASGRVRIAYAILSGILHFLVSWWFNYEWIFAKPYSIDGGPLGFLTWCIPALCGTVACDVVRHTGWRAAPKIAAWGCAVMLLGWCLTLGSTLYDVPAGQIEVASSNVDAAITSIEDSNNEGLNPLKFPPDPVMPAFARLRAWDGAIVEPPFVPPPNFRHRQWNYWMMSQQSGNVSYLTFSAGLSLVIFAIFLWVCDGSNRHLGLFRTLGTNSLAAYILHGFSVGLIGCHFPRDSQSVVLTLTGLVLTTLFVYVVCRLFEWRGWYLRV
jgi:predicted acyltransferase